MAATTSNTTRSITGSCFEKSDADFPYAVKHSTLDDYLDDLLVHRSEITDLVVVELRATEQRPGVEDIIG